MAGQVKKERGTLHDCKCPDIIASCSDYGCPRWAITLASIGITSERNAVRRINELESALRGLYDITMADNEGNENYWSPWLKRVMSAAALALSKAES